MGTELWKGRDVALVALVPYSEGVVVGHEVGAIVRHSDLQIPIRTEAFSSCSPGVLAVKSS